MRNLVVAALVVVPGAVRAQAAALLPASSADDAGLDEIIVTALPPSVGNCAYDVVTIDRARLTGSASGRIEDVLRDVAGFQQFRRTDSRTANPTSQGATLRALGGNASSRALVLLDGGPVADPFAGYIPWFALAPERLATARVTRGAGAGAFGSGALAGTIELVSADPATLPLASGSVDYGSRNSLSTSGAVASALGGGSAALFGRYDRGDGYVIIPANQRGPADIPARYSQGSLGGRVAAPLGDVSVLSLDALAFKDDRVRGLAGYDEHVKGASTSVRLTGGSDWRYDTLAYLQAQTFANDVVTLDAARAVATPSLAQYNTPALGFGGKIELRPPTGNTIELRIGVDFRHEDGKTEEESRFLLGRYTRLRQAGGTNETVGGYVEATATPLPGLTLTGGGRVDHWRIGGGFLEERDAQTFAPTIDEHPAAREHVEPTVRGGVAYVLTPAIAVRGAAYLGYRLPTLNELYRPFRVGADATGANSALTPERLRGIEAGVDLTPFPGVRAAVTAFYNRLGDAIGNVTVASGPGTFPEVGFVAAGGTYRQRQNIDAIIARGIEAEGHLARGPLRLDLSYAYTISRVHSPGTPLDGLRPAQTPEHQASATIGYTASFASASVTGRYLGSQFEDDQNRQTLASAATIDAVVEVPVDPRVSLVFRGENLTDTLIQSGISSNGVIDTGTPRTLWAGVRLKMR